MMSLSLRKNEEIVGGIYSCLTINCMVDIDPPNHMTNIPATDEPILSIRWTLKNWNFATEFHRSKAGSSKSTAQLLRFFDLPFYDSTCSVQRWCFHKMRQLRTVKRTGSSLPMLLWKWMDVEIQRHAEPQGSAELQEIFQLEVITSITIG